MKDKNLQKLKKEYNEIPIPDELDFVVRKAFRDSGVYNTKTKTIYKRLGSAVASLVIATGILAVGVNSSPTFAYELSKIPVVNSIVKVLTFKEYNINEDTYKADIKVPSIEGLKNKDLEDRLNEKYISENKKLYEDFIAEMEEMKEIDDGHLGIESGYVVKTDNENILSIGRYIVNTVGSSSTTFEYDTIDKKNEILITLPSLFKDNKYIEIISENIKEQMREEMKLDSRKIYWVADENGNGNMDIFKEIDKNQNFYINDKSELVISFNKYEVAPGYMGIVEFIIPTDILSNILVSNEYIK